MAYKQDQFLFSKCFIQGNMIYNYSYVCIAVLCMLVDVLCVQNYDYVMSVLLIEVYIHIIMDLHQVDYQTVSDPSLHVFLYTQLVSKHAACYFTHNSSTCT